MKRFLVYLVVVAIVIVGIVIAFSSFSKKANNIDSNVELSECSKFSNKDGYTGCMSLMNGKEKKCKFKVDNKINEATQQMEFTYTCLQK